MDTEKGAGSVRRTREGQGRAEPAAPPALVRAAPRSGNAAFRLLYRGAHLLLRVWWAIRRPAAEGAAVVVRAGGRVLVVETSYRAGVDLPGGGVGRGERPAEAAARELAEETGIRVDAEQLVPLGVVRFRQEHREVKEHLFGLVLERAPELRLDGREIVAARWLRPEEIAAFDPAPGLALWLAGRAATES